MRCWNCQVPLAKWVRGNFSTTAKKRSEARRIWQARSLEQVLLWELQDALSKGQWQQEPFSSMFPGGKAVHCCLRTENATAGLQVWAQCSRQRSPMLSFQRASLGFPKSHDGCLGPRWGGKNCAELSWHREAEGWWAVLGSGGVYQEPQTQWQVSKHHSSIVAFRSTHGQTMVDQRRWYLSVEIIAIVPENPWSHWLK